MRTGALIEQWRSLWLTPERLPLSQWAERNFILSSEYSKRTGPLQLFGWQREILDSFTDPRVNTVVLMCGTQLIKTLFIQVALAYVIAEQPGPALMVYPADGDAETFSKERIEPMVRDCQILHGKISDAKRDAANKIEHKRFPGGFVALVGSITPNKLARRPIRYLFCDEVDKFLASAGVEGDPIGLARERVATYQSLGKIILACSPTIDGRSRIARAYEESDQRRPWVPCPHCGERQVLKWAQVKWNNALPIEKRPGSAYYECEGCKVHWSDLDRWRAVEYSEWRADAPFTGTAGFWISHLYSPWKTLSQIVADFLVAKDNPEEFKRFVNTNLAELWKEQGEAPDHEKLMARREDSYRLGQVPAGALFLTAGVDVQKTWLEGYVYGWGRGRQRWVIDHFRIEHSPFESVAWEKLTGQLNQTYRRKEGGADLSIVRMAVDTGFAANEAYQWARQQGSGRVMAVDGRQHLAALAVSPTQVDVTVSGRRLKRGCKLWPVDVSACKSELYGLLSKDRPTEGEPYPAGWVHFAADLDQEFFLQLTAESLQTHVVKGYRKTEWIKTRERNEALDCAVYARAAAFVFGMDRRGSDDRWWGLLEGETVTQKPQMAESAPQAPPEIPIPAAQHTRPSGSFGGRDTSGWFRR